jgi:type IV secretion system protein VirB10
MDENQRNAEKDIDITGPGREEKIIKPESQQGGQRLSKKAKRYALLGLVSICGLILLGVAMSGRHGNKNSADGAFSNPDLIGQATPPSPPPVLASAEAPFPLLGDGHGPSHKALGNDPLSAGTASGIAGGQNSLTPAQKYREWLQDQYYKDLQGQVLAAQAAQSAPPGKAGERIGGSAPVQGNAVPAGLGNTPDFLRASLEAAKAGAAGTTAAGDPDSQNENKRFLEEQRKELDKNGYLAQSLQKPAGEHELFAGSIIPAVMITGINSDLPGEITAQVRQNVYDSLNSEKWLRKSEQRYKWKFRAKCQDQRGLATRSFR